MEPLKRDSVAQNGDEHQRAGRCDRWSEFRIEGRFC